MSTLRGGMLPYRIEAGTRPQWDAASLSLRKGLRKDAGTSCTPEGSAEHHNNNSEYS
jgi:hypothetical protein